MVNEGILFKCDGKVNNYLTEVIVDNSFVKFKSKRLNKIIPVKQISGCNIVNERKYIKIFFGIVFLIIGIYFFKNTNNNYNPMGIFTFFIGIILIIFSKVMYIQVNSASDRIDFYINKKNYEAQEFINVIQTAIYGTNK